MSSSGRDINQDKNNDQSKHQPSSSSSSSSINATVATNISSITKTALELLEEDDEFEVRFTMHYFVMLQI